MGSRKMRIAIVIVLFMISGAAWGEEYTGHFDKKGSLAFKFGTHFYSKSDLTDFWDYSPDVSFYPVEIAYEHKLGRSLGLEFSVCYDQMTDDRNYSATRASELDVKNLSFSPSVKYNLRLNNSSVLFLGAGPDIYQSRGKLDYSIATRNYEDDINEITWGIHGLIGFEYYIFTQPAKDNLYDWPLSIGLEYKYTYASIDDYDDEIVRKINAGEGTSHSANKLAIGGHSIAFALKWHFF